MTHGFGALACRGIACACVLAGFSFFSGDALAYPTFPDAVQSHLQMACGPTCLACHDSATIGGSDHMRYIAGGEPGLGLVLRDKYGLKVPDEGTVGPALDADALAGSDIDHDGVGDVDELKVGSDPNNPDLSARLCGDGIVLPEYGCARIARGTTNGTATATSLAVAVSLIVARRLRRLPKKKREGVGPARERA